MGYRLFIKGKLELVRTALLGEWKIVDVNPESRIIDKELKRLDIVEIDNITMYNLKDKLNNSKNEKECTLKSKELGIKVTVEPYGDG